MGNPYSVQIADASGGPVRVAGDLTFTDPANQPGGSYSPPTDREQVTGNTVTIADGATAFLPWNNHAGGTATLLDKTDPLNPTIVTAGIYGVTLEVIPSGLTAGGFFRVRLGMDTDNDDGEVSSSGSAPDFVAVSLTYYVPAAGVLQAFVFNSDGVAARDFHIAMATIQLVT